MAEWSNAPDSKLVPLAKFFSAQGQYVPANNTLLQYSLAPDLNVLRARKCAFSIAHRYSPYSHKAAQALKEAFSALESVGNRKPPAHCYRALAYLDMVTGDATAAKTHFEKAVSLLNTAGSERKALSAQGDLANLNWEQGHLNAAFAGFDQTMALRRKSSVTTSAVPGVALINFLGVLVDRGKLANALSAARSSAASA